MTVTERLSIRQVAQRTGVSRTTVSRALNDHPEISPETRQRVLKVVRELEYMPVQQPMVHNRQIKTGVIGLVFDGATLESLWGLPTFLGMREAAMEHDYDLLTLLKVRPDWMVDQEELQFLDRRSDGLIFIAPQDRYKTIKAIIKHQLPVVTSYTADVPPEVPAIVLDNKGAMHHAVEHLIAYGHQRILHLTTFIDRSDFRERQQGFDLAMRSAGLKPFTLGVHDITQEPDIKEFLTMLRQHRITAVACAADTLAYAAWDAVEANGMKVPQDISITGVDDMPTRDSRPLTTIHYSSEEVGRRSVEAIVGLMQGGDVRSVNPIVPMELVQRSSVAPA